MADDEIRADDNAVAERTVRAPDFYLDELNRRALDRASTETANLARSSSNLARSASASRSSQRSPVSSRRSGTAPDEDVRVRPCQEVVETVTGPSGAQPAICVVMP